MKAEVQGWKLWGKEHSYPVLVLQCSKDELEATEALHRLNKICAGLHGFGFQQKLAAVSNPDAIKDQGTVFTIDLGTLLTLLIEVETDKAKREFAVGWLRSLVDKIKENSPKKAQVFSCRCGQVFKKEKLYKKHKKLCTVLVRDFGLMLRAQESLKGLKEKKGKKHGKETGKNRRVRKDHEANELRSKVSARSKRKSKQK